MRNTGSSSASATDLTPPAAPAAGTARVLIENAAGREAFLKWVEKSLPEGEAVVEVRGLIGRRRAFRTVPLHPKAELVATERPLVMRGGLTALVSYYRVPVDGLDAEERHYEEGKLSHTYQVPAKVARLGRRKAPALLNA